MKIAIDPGHGGYLDRGTVVDGVAEADVNLDLGEVLADALEGKGYVPNLLRTTDKTLGHYTRARLAKGSDLVVSLHCNWNENPEVSGAWLFRWPEDPDGSRLMLSKMVMLEMPLELQPGRLYEISANDWRRRAHLVVGVYQAPCLLVECGFLSCAQDRKYLLTLNGKAAIAQGIANGVEKWVEWKTKKAQRMTGVFSLGNSF